MVGALLLAVATLASTLAHGDSFNEKIWRGRQTPRPLWRPILARAASATQIAGRARARYAFLVSAKIAAISSIFASSSSALATSKVPLVPAAPASLVASLIRVCRSGNAAKWGALK